VKPPRTAAPPIIESPALTADGVRHAFFTRQGGVSTGLYGSLNCGFGSDDDPAHVAENRRRAAGVIEVDDDALVTAYQIHGTSVVNVEAPWRRGDAPRADGMVTRVPGIALGILTADCAPVLFADQRAGVIGACHAGWRGVLDGIVEATLIAMERLGASPSDVRAAIGPCIAQQSYQVGPEFRETFVAAAASNAIHFVTDDEGRYRFDLAGYVAGRLRDAGVSQATWVGLDNCAEAGRLFSYRRSVLAGEPDFGRGLSAIMLSGDN
jgi:hypothetical protein